MPDYTDHRTSHCNCIVCGTANPIGLKMEFTADSRGIVHARFTGSSLFQGYKGILHGGFIATLLDATMTHCLFHHGVQALTGDLQVRFLNPVPFSAELDLSAEITDAYPPLYKVRSFAEVDRRLMARASGKFMRS
jgi:acyl-coenzyme A thioesterase PaaI-like protein